MADDASPLATAPRPDQPQPARFTADEFERMAASGLFGERRVELRGGVIWEMNASHTLHALTTLRVARRLEDGLLGIGADLVVSVEGSIRFADFYPTADVLIFQLKDLDGPVQPEDVRLVVEIADASLRDDLGDKKNRYEAAGVPEYWVVDVTARRVLRFALRAGRFVAAPEIAYGEPAESLTLPGLALATADLPTV